MTKKEFLRKILADIFTISVITWAVFFLSELIKAGFVTNYLNMNLFLLWCVLTGIIHILINKS